MCVYCLQFCLNRIRIKVMTWFFTCSYVYFENRCAYADSIAAFVYMDGEERKLLRHCGANPPPNLMSNGHRMTVEFRARATTTAPAVRGFYAQYFFVESKCVYAVLYLYLWTIKMKWNFYLSFPFLNCWMRKDDCVVMWVG